MVDKDAARLSTILVFGRLLVVDALYDLGVLLTDHLKELRILALQNVRVLGQSDKVGADTARDTSSTDAERNVEAQAESDKQDD